MAARNLDVLLDARDFCDLRDTLPPFITDDEMFLLDDLAGDMLTDLGSGFAPDAQGPALPTLPSLASDPALRGRSTSLPAAFRFGETAPGGGISWRAAAARRLGDPSVSAALVTRGLPPLLGCTPSLLFKGRDAEIGAWLLANEASLAPGCRWIAIDDMLMPTLQAHLVRTRPSGLRETDVLKAVDLLMFGTVSTGEPPPSDDGGFSGGASTHSRSSGTGSSDAEPGAAGGALTGSVSLNLRTWECRCDFCSLQSRRADQLASSPLLRLARRSAVM